jgi:hypothetical protein
MPQSKEATRKIATTSKVCIVIIPQGTQGAKRLPVKFLTSTPERLYIRRTKVLLTNKEKYVIRIPPL